MNELIQLRTLWLKCEQEYKVAESSLDSSPLQVVVCKEALKQARFSYNLACRDFVEALYFSEESSDV